MSAASIKALQQTLDLDDLISKTSKTISPQLEDQLKQKYKTFTRFNFREVVKDARVSKKKNKDISKIINSDIGGALANFLMSLAEGESKNDKKGKKKVVIQQLAGIKSERRERFKKSVNIYHIFKHYIEKQHFKPTEEEMYLMKSLAELKQFSEQNGLDPILRKIYKAMNEAVDLNQLRFLCLLIILSADVCFQFKDFNRSLYFYNEAKLYASYSELHQVKTEALMSMAVIAMEMKLYYEAVIFLKKSLQYAWKTRNIQSEMTIYDFLGSCYYYDGKLSESHYYHKRFTQGEYERSDSAIKKISVEMLQQYEKHLYSLQKKNLTSLFIQYVNLPIYNLEKLPVPVEFNRKVYENYDEEGLSPRKRRLNKEFQYYTFPQAQKLIQKLLREDYQFKTLIPNPDMQTNFLPIQKFGKPRKTINFEQSAQFHKITGQTHNKINLSELHSYTLDARIQKALSQRQNPNWFQQMKDKIRKTQLQKVGQMRDRVFNSHQSYNKYPQQKRRAYSLKNEKIKHSFNKTLLDWIDPTK